MHLINYCAGETPGSVPVVDIVVNLRACSTISYIVVVVAVLSAVLCECVLGRLQDVTYV